MFHSLGGAAPDLPEGSGGVLGKLLAIAVTAFFGSMGGNLLLTVILLLSVTLATGLSWFALMDWIGGLVLKLIDRLGKKKVEAAEWQRTKVLREEREEVRKPGYRKTCQTRTGKNRNAGEGGS